MNGLGENVVVQANNDRIFPCAIDFKQHCGHDEHNVWRAVATRSCGPEK